MAVYLDEDMVGEDSKEIGYPHLLLCMGVTCLMSDGLLIGAHVTNGNTEDNILAELKRRIENAEGDPKLLYVTGNFDEHTKNGGKMPNDKARAIGYLGTVYSYDTGKLKPTDGSFVRLVSQGGSEPCDVYAFKDQDAKPYGFQQGGAPSSVSEYKNGNWQSPRFYKPSASAPYTDALSSKELHVLKVH